MSSPSRPTSAKRNCFVDLTLSDSESDHHEQKQEGNSNTDRPIKSEISSSRKKEDDGENQHIINKKESPQSRSAEKTPPKNPALVTTPNKILTSNPYKATPQKKQRRGTEEQERSSPKSSPPTPSRINKKSQGQEVLVEEADRKPAARELYSSKTVQFQEELDEEVNSPERLQEIEDRNKRIPEALLNEGNETNMTPLDDYTPMTEKPLYPEVTFDVNIGFVGPISVGKSTILNTILGANYNPTAMKGCTAGARKFRLFRSNYDSRKRKMSDRVVDEPESQDAQSEHVQNIFDSISDSNESGAESETLDEKVFDLDVGRGFLLGGEQRSDAILSFMDYPGLNDAKKKDLYLDSLAKMWSSLDCVVVVLDAQKDCSAEMDIADLLDNIKAFQRDIRKLPLIFVANKVDAVEDEELKSMVEGMKKTLEATFNNVSFKSYGIEDNDGVFSPVSSCEAAFCPISAQYALLFETAKRCFAKSGMNGLDEFKSTKVEFKLIERFGLEEMGKYEWKNLDTEDAKYTHVFQQLNSNAGLLKSRIKETNFNSLLELLKATCTGKDQQKHLLQSKLKYELEKSASSEEISEKLLEIQSKAEILELEPDVITNFFWTAYETSRKEATNKLEDMPDPRPLSLPLEMLKEYQSFLLQSRMTEKAPELKRIYQEYEQLVRFQIKLVAEKFDAVWGKSGPQANRSPRFWGSSEAWQSLTPEQWHVIVGSMLLAGDGRAFKSLFCRELISLRCAEAKIALEASVKGSFGSSVETMIPESFESGSHWGYTINAFCTSLKDAVSSPPTTQNKKN